MLDSDENVSWGLFAVPRLCLFANSVPACHDNLLLWAGAIIEYVVEFVANGKLGAPRSNVELYTRYLYWLHYAEGSLLPPALISLFVQVGFQELLGFFKKG